MATFDFGQDVLDRTLERLPAPQAGQIRTALAQMPYSIDVDAKVRVCRTAHLGARTRGPSEEFIPLLVTTLLAADYDPSQTVGWRDPMALQRDCQPILGPKTA